MTCIAGLIENGKVYIGGGGYAEKDKEAEKGGCFLVGVGGRLFQIESDYQVAEALVLPQGQ
jgi:hypothetical protein